MYVDINTVRNTIGVTDTDIISDATITQAIKFAEDEVDRLTQTTYYPVEDSGTATSATATTIVDSTQSWTEDEWIGNAVYIYSGTGEGQIREITDNDSTSLTVATWTTNPDATSKFVITYLNKQTLTIDGSGTYNILLQDYPIVQVDSLTVDSTSIDSDDYYVYKDTGKLVLKTNAGQAVFTSPTDNQDRKLVTVTYHWGVLPENRRGTVSMPQHIKRMCAIIAGLQALAYQEGTTYDDLSTFNVPNLAGSIGQAYVNINSVINSISKELNTLKQQAVGKYPFMV